MGRKRFVICGAALAQSFPGRLCSAPPFHPLFRDPLFLSMKTAAKYILTLFAFVLIAYGLSWAAVYSFWFTAFWFHSVAAVRIGEALGSVILIPVRVLFWFMGDMVDQSTPLYDPRAYASINSALLGIVSYFTCRSWIFKASLPSPPAKE